MKIAILGTRGIPARYGGFETFAEELSTRLVERGHEVTVYGRRPFGEEGPSERYYRGVNLVYTPTIMSKYLETPLHALSSLIDLLRRKIDVVLLCNAANSPFAWLVIPGKKKLVINVDGIERRRSKWNAAGRAWYRLGEVCSLLFADRVIADARAIASYYQATYLYLPSVIGYGAQGENIAAGATIEKFGLESRKYILYVSRLEPENNALGVIRAHRDSRVNMPLVIVGDAPYASEYKGALRQEAGPGVIFTGFQFGEAYRELQSHAYLYVQATEVGGTHPALVEAMAHGNCVVANGTPENLEVLGGGGVFYFRNDFPDLAKKIAYLVLNPVIAGMYRQLATERAGKRYSWDVVTSQYETLFRECMTSLYQA